MKVKKHVVLQSELSIRTPKRLQTKYRLGLSFLMINDGANFSGVKLQKFSERNFLFFLKTYKERKDDKTLHTLVNNTKLHIQQNTRMVSCEDVSR